jgi:hypothetical protein
VEAPAAVPCEGWGPPPDDVGPFPLTPSPLRWAGQYAPPRAHSLGGWPTGGWALDGTPLRTADSPGQGRSKGGPSSRPPRLLRAGLRGVEEGTGADGIPTPDLLRWIGHPPSEVPVIDLDSDAWIRLLDGTQVETTTRGGGGLLLALRGTVLGTAIQRQGRLLHRLPEARARWLRQALAHRDPGLTLSVREPGR